MPSFDIVNYSLRPSKSIQRQLAFEGLRKLHEQLTLTHSVYVGLGSIWFTDFVMAHKQLGIEEMFSIECDSIGVKRARFNAPYATVKVKDGATGDELPKLLSDPAINTRSWIVWLDYDTAFDESVREDIRLLVERAPRNSIFLATFNGHEMEYGHAQDRIERLRTLFGEVVPDDMPKKAVKEDRMQETLANLSLAFMKSIANDVARAGGFVPAFRMIYQDSAPMVTVGGILPTVEAAVGVANTIATTEWSCCPPKPIKVPHLTMREAVAIQSLLPKAGGLTRADIQGIGFDLMDEQVEAFVRYYKQYPAFAQILA